MSPKGGAAATQTSTCDRCRVLKVKCHLVDDESGGSSWAEPGPSSSRWYGQKHRPCKRCSKAGVECVFQYEFKKSGRPPGANSKRQSSRDRPSISRRSTSPRRSSSATVHTHPSVQPTFIEPHIPEPFLSPTEDHVERHHDDVHSWGPIRESIFGSARTALEGATVGTDSSQPWLSGLFTRRPSFDFSLPPEGDQPFVSSGISREELGQMDRGVGIGGAGPSSVPAFGPSPSGSNMSAGHVPNAGAVSNNGMGGNMGSMSMPGMGTNDKWGTTAPVVKSDYFSELGGPMIQVEAIGTWSEFCFFVSLFMRHQHALVPLVHKPSFAMDVLNRRDQRDEAFRGLLFSIVTYTICQCPINMMSNDFSRERLLTLLERCQQASRLVQIRHLSRPNLVIAASTELDILSSQATNKPELTLALFSDAQRIIYSLRLNAIHPAEGATAVDIEVGRRIFWHLYTTDKTNVMNGGHMLVNHHEVIPPLPLEIDDEHLSNSVLHSAHPTTDGHKHTYIAGYVALIKIFKILGECQHRHRTLLNDPEAGQDLPTLMRWLDSVVDRLRRITDNFASDLPLRKSRTQCGGVAGNGGSNSATSRTDSDVEATAGIQQANICITALCAEFALLDFRLALRPEEDLRPEREGIAKAAFATLSGIPIEYLASNGEAMRGKVLRTILALFNASTSPEELGDSVWDWWSMYSQVQFIQVIPAT